jgi:hypothetical protein
MPCRGGRNGGEEKLRMEEHRMEKARRSGIKEVPAYRLSVAQHIRFLTSQSAYIAYIEYWNSKLN